MSKKIALIADIHANVLALEAVLARIAREGIDEIWMLGDVVGYGPRPLECLEMLAASPIPLRCVLGNTDGYVLDTPWHLGQSLTAEPFAAAPEQTDNLAWTVERLGEAGLEKMRAWSLVLKFGFESREACLFHGSFGNPETGIQPATQADELPGLVGGTAAMVVGCGHVHRPFFRENELGLKLINPGSVGAPLDEDPRASYAVIEFDPARLAIAFHRAEYAIDKVVADATELKMPWVEYMTQLWKKGKLPKVAAPVPAAPAGAAVPSATAPAGAAPATPTAPAPTPTPTPETKA